MHDVSTSTPVPEVYDGEATVCVFALKFGMIRTWYMRVRGSKYLDFRVLRKTVDHHK